ncbi:MAG: hypothetical protein PHG23_01050 [Candidatus Pacebacteria bacterium]|nr:hypothetical protein [Candidatus Paceibacterota bacterium]
MKYIQNIPWYKPDYLNQPFNKEESLHYFFYFQKGSLAEQNRKNIVDTKENHYKKILSWLNLDNNRKIGYFLYPSLKEKAALMGDNSPGNAIWQELENNVPKKFEIHVVYDEKCKFIGEHEDTHLLSLPWGLSIYLLCEGLAQYMENSFMDKELYAVSGDLLRENKLYSLEWLCDNNNWEEVEPTIIYPQVGSFAKFLLEQYGKDKFKEVYQNTSRNSDISENLSRIEKIYSKSIGELEKEWIKKIS